MIGNGTIRFAAPSGRKDRFFIMRRHRGLLYGLALMALTGLMANRADAGSISLSVDLNGVVIYSTSSISPDTSVSALIGTLNSSLQGAGSAYRFSSLSADSNYTGAANGLLQINAQLFIGVTGTTAAVLSIDASQSGFLSPVGPEGVAKNTVGGSGGDISGSLESTGDYQGALLPTLSQSLSGSNVSYSQSTPDVPVGTVPSGYELSAHVLVSLSKNTQTTLGVTSTTTVTANTVPEPASVVMLLTGLPVPLVFMGLLRRRKAKA